MFIIYAFRYIKYISEESLVIDISLLKHLASNFTIKSKFVLMFMQESTLKWT